jgi:hypothetical protein
MDLIRDVLDNQLVDRNKRRLGKVDGIIAELQPGQPPIVKCIEVGLVAKARRFYPGLAKWLGRWSQPSRIPWTAIIDIGTDVEVAPGGGETTLLNTLLNTERRARKIVCKIPGN